VFLSYTTSTSNTLVQRLNYDGSAAAWGGGNQTGHSSIVTDASNDPRTGASGMAADSTELFVADAATGNILVGQQMGIQAISETNSLLTTLATGLLGALGLLLGNRGRDHDRDISGRCFYVPWALVFLCISAMLATYISCG
jgi:hypothetical protein